ncbi:minor fimbrial subunit/fimbrial-like protein [Acinetobacter calcoaceticus]|uniref:Minor fimbrial subunit/fimbrial-like protein n=1 Tax=Acinetobacter calcoaceticus TaxID=471 RepID=A0A4R1XM95_ACICA|nr:minor fimbrial subunit/fimbrial-like protein [Acinetobacter calcoaceticus]
MNVIYRKYCLIALISLHCMTQTQLSRADVELGRINVELYGVVKAVTCGVIESGKDKHIELGRYNSREFNQAGDHTPLVSIPFELANCPPNTAVNITFSGALDAKNKDFLAIEKGQNAAQNIAIEIRDHLKKRLVMGTKSPDLIVDDRGRLSTVFYANYIVTQNGVKPGTANASAEFVIRYD